MPISPTSSVPQSKIKLSNSMFGPDREHFNADGKEHVLALPDFFARGETVKMSSTTISTARMKEIRDEMIIAAAERRLPGHVPISTDSLDSSATSSDSVVVCRS